MYAGLCGCEIENKVMFFGIQIPTEIYDLCDIC